MEKLPKDFVPSFDILYAKTCDFVKKHQGKKGYIDTQDKKCDMIWGFIFDDQTDRTEERVVRAVRYNYKIRELEVVLDVYTKTYEIVYSDKDFKDAEWKPIVYCDVLYIQTLCNIAEVIHEYV